MPSNGSHCITVADDLRDTYKRERSKILGVAVMLPAPKIKQSTVFREEIVGKCWLVPISKQVETEKIVEGEPILIEHTDFKNCALVSNNQALIFSRSAVHSVSLKSGVKQEI